MEKRLSGTEKLKQHDEKWLQERDWEIMRVIYEEQFLSLMTVSKYFFNDAFKAASKRVIKLNQMRLVRYEELDLPHKPKMVRLTRSGIDRVRSISPFDIKQKRKLPIATIYHDQLVSEMRLELMRRFDAKWIPEKALKATKLNKVPDGILVFESGKRIGIELENTVKSYARYIKMWHEWETQDFLVIVFIATTDAVYRALMRHMSSFRSNKVCLGLIKFHQLQKEQNPKVWTADGELNLFMQRTF